MQRTVSSQNHVKDVSQKSVREKRAQQVKEGRKEGGKGDTNTSVLSLRTCGGGMTYCYNVQRVLQRFTCLCGEGAHERPGQTKAAR